MGGMSGSALLSQRQASRVAALIDTARASPLYRRLHGHRVDRRTPLDHLPAVGRETLMAGFDDWCTDRAITLDSIAPFLATPTCTGTPFLGRYAAWTSSGTTGTPGIYLHDGPALAIYDALEMIRFRRPLAHGRSFDASSPGGLPPWWRVERCVMLGATGGHFAGNATIERLRGLGPWMADRIRMVSIMQPIGQIVAELEACRPTILATYPTAIEMLATEQSAGRLRLTLDEIWTGGEQLSDPVKAEIERVFRCAVRNGYGASEFPAIGWDCTEGVMHFNSDWVVLEPIDRRGHPVTDGAASHSVLLTNLANRIQPLIRYDLGDSVRLLPGCACGSPFPAIHLEGRADDVLAFATDDPSNRRDLVKLLPLALVTVLEEAAGLFDFQLVQSRPMTLALRLGPSVVDPVQARRRAKLALRRFLDGQRLRSVRLTDDPDMPARSQRSGKLRRIIRAGGAQIDATAAIDAPRKRRSSANPTG